MASLFRDEVLDKASTGHDGGAEQAREVWVHVRTATPAFLRTRQLQANLVFEHVRRRVDLDVHGPPKSDPHGRAVWCRSSLTLHSGFPPSNWFGPQPTS